MRRHWSAMVCLLLIGWQTPACSGSDQAGERSAREATAAERTTRHAVAAREAKRSERQSKVERIRPEPRAVARASLPARAVRKDVASVRLPSHLSSFDDLLAKLTPAQAIEKLEETMGPLQGAHYVLQRDSGVKLVDDGWRYLEGELSLIDCRDTELAAQLPSRSFPYWVGGVRFSDAPDAIEPVIDGKTTVPLLGGPGIADDPRWRDMHVNGASVTRFGRTLALEPEQEGDGWARVLRRELVLDRYETSEAIFQSESSACPLEFTVHLVLQEVSSLWEADKSDGASRARPVPEEREVEILGRVTLIAHEVSSTPEIFDLDQRVVRLRASTELRPLGQSRLRVLPGTLEALDPESGVLRAEGVQERQ